jgi:hypothetical protein
MAVTGYSDAALDGLGKNVYENFRTNLFPKLNVLLAQIKKGKAGGAERMRWGGKGVFYNVVTTAAVGASFSAAGYLPQSADANEEQASVGVKRNYIRKQVDRLAVQGYRGGETSFVPLMRKLTEEAMDSGRWIQEFSLQGDGRGILGLVASRTSATEFTVTKPYGFATALGQGGLWLQPGMCVAAMDASDSFATRLTAVISTISTVTNSGDTATVVVVGSIEGGGTLAAGDAIVLSNTATDGALDALPDGLIKITNRADTAAYDTVCAISQASHPRWDAVRLVAGTDTADAGQISEMDIHKLIAKVFAFSGKDARANPGEFLLMTTPGLEIGLAESLVGQRQRGVEMEMKAGFKGINVCGLPLVTSAYCPIGTVYLIHLPSLAMVDALDFTKLAFEGTGPWRFIAERDAYELNFSTYWNIATLNRAAHGSITSYTDTARYTPVI